MKLTIASAKTKDPINLESTKSVKSKSKTAINKTTRLRPANNNDVMPKTEC